MVKRSRSHRSRKLKKTASRRKYKKLRFGSDATATYGPGYKGLTSFENAVAAPFYGYDTPFINASEWFYPIADGKMQSPDMLKNFSNFGRRRRRRRASKRKSRK